MESCDKCRRVCVVEQSALHFGLGKDQTASKVEIEWPSGLHQRLVNVDVDRLVTIEESAN